MNANNNLPHEEKVQISRDLQTYVDTHADGSMNKASKLLMGVSNAYLGYMCNPSQDKWPLISDQMWIKVRKQISRSATDEGEWVMVKDTAPYQAMAKIFEDARNYAMTFGVTAFTGTGKTETIKSFGADSEFYYVQCSDYFNKKEFLVRLLRSMGKTSNGYTIAEMMDTVIDTLHKADKPVIVLDEADKLPDPVLYFFITLYNELEGKCGMVIIATDYLAKRISRGVATGKKGYPEILSRIGRRFLEVQPPSEIDIRRIIKANGLEDDMIIQQIINASQGDLRRVKRLVFAEKRKMKEAA